MDMRAEVGLLSSTILITSPDGATQAAAGGAKFGPRVLAGASAGRVQGSCRSRRAGVFRS
jgi:hypothetical protein